MIALAFLIGWIDDYNKPKAYHYENEIVILYDKYQCPTYCGVDHHHFAYYEGETTGKVVEKAKLGDRYKPPKKNKKKSLH